MLTAAIAWNLTGNLLLPAGWYVPANLAVAAALVALARISGLGWDELGLCPRNIPRGLAIGLASAAIVAAGLAIALAIPAGSAALATGAVHPASTFDRWFVPLVRIPLGTALFEETLFRAVTLALLLRRHGTGTAVVVSSALFGLWHVTPAWETAHGNGLAVAGAVGATVALTTLAGLIFAALRLWARSLAAPVLTHTATNSLAFVAVLIATDATS